MLTDTMRDVRFGLRSLARRPGFTAITVLVLALGVGATITIFTLVERLFLAAPAHVTRPEELIRVFRSSGAFRSGAMDYADYLDYREAASSEVRLAASSSGKEVVTARLGESVLQVDVSLVTENWFEVLGVRPFAGRFFLATENRSPGADPVAVVSHAFWRDHLGGSPAAVGRDFVLNGNRYTIVGVTPRGFTGFEPSKEAADVYIPIVMLPTVSPRPDNAWYERIPGSRENWINVIGRLSPGASVERIQAMLSAMATGLHPPRAGRDAENVWVAADYRWSPVRRESLWNLTRMMMGAVTVLLIVAGANVAILLLARASTRDREMGIRSAIGAGRWRLLRQLFAESLLLGIGGAALGSAFAFGATGLAASMLPVRLDVLPRPDTAVLLFALCVSLITAIAVGSLPALRATRADVVGLIQGRTRYSGGSGLRDGLIVFQTALSIVLVVGAALFSRSLATARDVDVGFDTGNTLTIGVELDARGYDLERSRTFLGQALERIRSVPGVTDATASRMVPFRGDWSTEPEPWSDAHFAGNAAKVVVGLNAVGAGYFDAMGIPIVRGRAIEDGDIETSARVIVVNETFARTVFPGEEALGRTVPLRGGEAPPLLIVGVARDARYYAFDEEPQIQVYGSILQQPVRSFSFIIRTAGSAAVMARPVEDALRGLDADLAFPRVETFEQIHDGQLAAWRTSASVVGVAGLIALLLASAGLYGVMAFRVAERTREIGVRMAFGASRRGVASTVLRRGLGLALAGSAIGLAGALAIGRLVRSLLFGVTPNDPFSFVVAPIVLLAIAVLAVLVPARRAMAVDPMRAIRSE